MPDLSLYKVTDTELTNLADLIRAKKGINYSISYPEGFIYELKTIKPYSLYDVAYKKMSTLQVDGEDPLLTHISEYYFAYFTDLKNITFPECVYIDQDAFEACRSLNTVNFPVCSYIGSYAFYNCTALSEINFPNCNYIGGWAFVSCWKLVAANFPACSYINGTVFSNCSALATANFPVCTYINNYAFNSCRSLGVASFPACSYIGSSAFYSCSSLISLYFLGSSVPNLYSSNAFNGTPMINSTYTGSFGSIYVRASLLDTYKSATNWTTYSNRLVGV